MKANNSIKVFDLELNRPTLKIGIVAYDWTNDLVSIELIFIEEGSLFEHSRQLIKPTNGQEFSSDDIIEIVQNEFKDFN